MTKTQIDNYLDKCKVEKDGKVIAYNTVKATVIASSPPYALFAEYINERGDIYFFCDGRPYVQFTEYASDE